MRRIFVAGFSLLVSTASVPACASERVPPASGAPCDAWPDAVVVTVATHRLALCDGRRLVEELPVALGSGGVGKQREGDARTPLGTYPLAPGRPSDRFHTFLLVGYPTPAQRRAGQTGGAVGVHGPARSTRHMGSAINTALDWTLGCIALGSDEEIDRVAAFVRAHGVTRIHLE